jgi:hypothetical protein
VFPSSPAGELKRSPKEYQTMSLLSDFFITTESDVSFYDGDPSFSGSDRVQLNRITPLEAAGLLEALRGGGDGVEMISEFPLLTPQDADAWTMGVPDDFVSRLAGLDDGSVRDVAKTFADITVEELGWSSDDAFPFVRDLSTLARRAQTEGKRMFLWNSL